MERYEDLEEMIEILITAMAIHEREEEFFRRSAASASSEVARTMLTEIADDLAGHRKDMEMRRQRLVDALESLKSAEKQGVKRPKEGSTDMATDPVCGMKVDATSSTYASVYKGEHYYFCSANCRDAFNLAPEKYVHK
jgi:YHS domain-containing protein